MGQMAGNEASNGERADLGVKTRRLRAESAASRGQHKAQVFALVLGITLANRKCFETPLLDAAYPR